MDIRGPCSSPASKNEKPQGRSSMDRSRVSNKSTIVRLSLIVLCSAQTLRDVHAEGKTRADIEHALEIIPFVSPFAFTQLLN